MLKREKNFETWEFELEWKMKQRILFVVCQTWKCSHRDQSSSKPNAFRGREWKAQAANTVDGNSKEVEKQDQWARI